MGLGDKEFIKYLDKDGEERLRLKIQTKKGQVLDIVVQYESFIDKKWTPILRYDCAHDFFHRDVMYPSGEKEKHPIAIDNLNDALSYAEQDLKDRWRYYKKRFVKQKKIWDKKNS